MPSPEQSSEQPRGGFENANEYSDLVNPASDTENRAVEDAAVREVKVEQAPVSAEDQASIQAAAAGNRAPLTNDQINRLAQMRGERPSADDIAGINAARAEGKWFGPF